MNPIRPELFEPAPLFYAVVELSRYASLPHLMTALRLPAAVMQQCQAVAVSGLSDCVVLVDLRMGDPDLRMAGVLAPIEGGGVALCAGFFGQLTTDRDEAAALARDLSDTMGPAQGGRLAFVGEVRQAAAARVPS